MGSYSIAENFNPQQHHCDKLRSHTRQNILCRVTSVDSPTVCRLVSASTKYDRSYWYSLFVRLSVMQLQYLNHVTDFFKML